MSDAYFKRVVGEYMPYVKDCKPENLEDWLIQIAKHVERDMRHKAGEIVAEAYGKIENMRHTEGENNA